MKLNLTLILLFFLAACQTNSNKPQEVDTVIEDSTAPTELLDSGMVIQMEDVGYPMFALDLISQQNGKTHSFLLNIEAINITHEEAYKLKDKQATVTYALKHEPMVMDIIHEDTSIMGEYALPHRDDFERVSEVISGAEEESQGDLPREFTITSSDGKTMMFEYYIDESLANINGNTATVFYEIRDVSVVQSIKLHE